MFSIFTCTVCLGERIAEINPTTIGEADHVCAPCVKQSIVPLFKEALEHEFNYPVVWADSTLQAKDFVDVLGKEFVERYERIETEYSTPQNARVYCKNMILAEDRLERGQKPKGFKRRALGDLAHVKREQEKGHEVIECGAFLCTRGVYEDSAVLQPECWSCRGRACPGCGEALFATSRRPRHICDYEGDLVNDVLKELTRGKDYQLCPNHDKCGGVLALWDGCNFVRCPESSCNAGLCFICGESVPQEAGSDHWIVGKPCPKFGQPGTEEADHDRFHGPDAERNAEEALLDFQRLLWAEAQARLERLEIRVVRLQLERARLESRIRLQEMILNSRGVVDGVTTWRLPECQLEDVRRARLRLAELQGEGDALDQELAAVRAEIPLVMGEVANLARQARGE